MNYPVTSVVVNTKRKAERIIKQLRKQNRVSFYEEWCDYNGFFYKVYYRKAGNDYNSKRISERY